MLLTIFSAEEARKSPSKLRREFATNFAENFANFTLEIAGAYLLSSLEDISYANWGPIFLETPRNPDNYRRQALNRQLHNYKRPIRGMDPLVRGTDGPFTCRKRL